MLIGNKILISTVTVINMVLMIISTSTSKRNLNILILKIFFLGL